MSTTRTLIERLRLRLGLTEPLTPVKPPDRIDSVPTMVFPYNGSPHSGFAAEAAEHTTALLGIGHVGTRYSTDVVLQFQAELAVAHDAVLSELPSEWAGQNGFVPLKTRVNDHHEFLLRPDLGRRLDKNSLDLVRTRGIKNPNVQIILADGLSARACTTSGPELFHQLQQECQAKGLTTGTPFCAKFSRVWLEDEIGAVIGAKIAVILLGERPGLGTGDGLSAYMVYAPQLGRTDGDRNMISNIHNRGTNPSTAAKRLTAMATAMIEQACSGVSLDLSQIEKGQLSRGYSAAPKRQRLVEVFR